MGTVSVSAQQKREDQSRIGIRRAVGSLALSEMRRDALHQKSRRLRAGGRAERPPSGCRWPAPHAGRKLMRDSRPGDIRCHGFTDSRIRGFADSRRLQRLGGARSWPPQSRDQLQAVGWCSCSCEDIPQYGPCLEPHGALIGAVSAAPSRRAYACDEAASLRGNTLSPLHRAKPAFPLLCPSGLVVCHDTMAKSPPSCPVLDHGHVWPPSHTQLSCATLCSATQQQEPQQEQEP